MFEILTFSKMQKESDLLNVTSAKWTRFEIDLKEKSVNSTILAHAEQGGGYDLPNFNFHMAGEETCVTYLIALFTEQTIDEDYGWKFSKYDACK